MIPHGVRFQVSLPLTESGTRLFIGHSPESFQPMWDAYQDAMRRELAQLSREIPPGDLAVQWDIAAEVACIEANDHDPMMGLPWDAPGDPFDRYGQALVDLSPHVHEDALLGLHLCYGDLGHKHFKEPEDLGLVVRMANAGVAAIRRPVDFVHMPVPRNRHDDAYFAPLADLSIGTTKLFLGSSITRTASRARCGAWQRLSGTPVASALPPSVALAAARPRRFLSCCGFTARRRPACDGRAAVLSRRPIRMAE